MSAQEPLTDSEVLTTATAMLVVMFDALNEIAKLEPSLDAGIAMRSIAANAIADVSKISGTCFEDRPGTGRCGAAFQPEEVKSYAAAA